MAHQEVHLTEKESIDLITSMINKAKNSYYNTGIGAIMWGSIIALCSLVKLAEIQFDFRLPFDIYLLTIIAVIPQVFITVREKKEKRVKSYDDAYMDYIWLGFGISIFLMIVIINILFRDWEPAAIEYKSLSGHALAFQLSEYISSLFLLLYGLPTFVTGAACRFRPMFWGGIICWVCCVISLFTIIKIDLLLVAFSAIVSWLVPGIIMKKDHRKAKLELAKTDV
ncbi:MAG TPA: hypothetical protein PKC72_03960 [Chitinophagaceae bacterium]|nr:hypothetical protein [Chitinophagaceae bacterium]